MKNILTLALVTLSFASSCFAAANPIASGSQSRSSFYYVGETKLDGADTFVVFEQALLPKYSTALANPVFQLTLTEENGNQNSITVQLTENTNHATNQGLFSGKSALNNLLISIEQSTSGELLAHLTYKSETIDFSLAAPRAMQAL